MDCFFYPLTKVTVTIGHGFHETHTTTLAAGESLLDHGLAGLANLRLEKSVAGRRRILRLDCAGRFIRRHSFVYK
jgi:hypothetical protein